MIHFRNILPGILSQDGDPAKVLADAYVVYMASVGATVDYTTVYNIYKDEYLTDPDKDNIMDWYDFRAGSKGTGINYKLYSLIFPYRNNNLSAAATSIADNERIVGGYLRGIDLSYFNSLGHSMWHIAKVALLGTEVVLNLSLIPIQRFDGASVNSNILRCTTLNRLQSLTGGLDGTTINIVSASLPTTPEIGVREVNWATRKHILITSASSTTQSFPETTELAQYSTLTQNSFGTYIYGWSNAQVYWHKFYKIPS